MGEGLSPQEGLPFSSGRKRGNEAGLQHLAPANKLPANGNSVIRQFHKQVHL